MILGSLLIVLGAMVPQSLKVESYRVVRTARPRTICETSSTVPSLMPRYRFGIRPSGAASLRA